jgi:solute:Na+ symporter, SSS family
MDVSELRHLNHLDYVIVGVYMLMVVAVGLYLTRFNKKTEDYFKGGGYIPWRLSGISLFVSGFSAFMFVGAAGYTYRNGGSAIILFSLAFPAYLLGYWIYGRLWRRTRIDTPMQFLGRRYSPGTTYFYTVLSVVPNVLMLGISIYILCIFISTALGFGGEVIDLGVLTLTGFQLTLLVTGTVLVIYTMLGGLWAVIVTDALQFLVLFLVTLIVLPAAYFFLGDGNIGAGVSRLLTEAPEGYFGFAAEGQVPLFWAAYFINIVLGYNVNWHIAQRYYSVPDERDTRKMALFCAVFSLILPLMWITPVMASRVLFPELAAMWPELAEPSEAAFVTLAMTILPHGMLGIMVAAIFAATMSSADTTFNWLAAVVTKDVFVPVHQRLSGRDASERLQLRVGKTSVAVMGVLAIWIALNMERFGGAFDVYLRANSLYSAPMFIPVILGLVFTRTPWWSGMVAFGVGVLAVLTASIAANVIVGMPVNSFGAIFANINLTVLGVEMGRYELNTMSGVIASTACFFGSAVFSRREGAFKQRIESLEHDLRTPATAEGEKLDLRGIYAYRLAGILAIVIGTMLIAMVVPTWTTGGAPLNFIAGVLAMVLGILVVVGATRYERRVAREGIETPEPAEVT